MSLEVCRVCLSTESLTCIFKRTKTYDVCEKIKFLSGVHIQPQDGLSDQVCKKCLKRLHKCVQFIELCRKTDSKLRIQRRFNSITVTQPIESDCNSEDLDIDVQSNTGDFNKESDIRWDVDNLEDLSFDTANCDSPDPIVSDTNIDTKPKDIAFDKSKKRKAQKAQCTICGKIMSSRFRLTNHLRIHTGEQPYACSYCDRKFAMKQTLQIHMRVHTGEKPLKCSLCGARFAHAAGLSAHKLKHTGLMPHQCPQCPRTFRTMSHLQYHIRGHRGEKKYECDNCDRAFINRSDLQKHNVIHSGIKPHVCCICGLAMTRASHLKRHMATHTGKKFKCEHCPSRFVQISSLVKHRKKHADKEEEAD